MLQWFSCSSTPITCCRASFLVGGNWGRPGDCLKFMMASVIGAHRVIGSLIKDKRVAPRQVASQMLFQCVWAIIKLFDVTSVSGVFSPDVLWWHLPTFIYLLIFLLIFWLTACDTAGKFTKPFDKYSPGHGGRNQYRSAEKYSFIPAVELNCTLVH